MERELSRPDTNRKQITQMTRKCLFRFYKLSVYHHFYLYLSQQQQQQQQQQPFYVAKK